jgi:hypothetical protein
MGLGVVLIIVFFLMSGSIQSTGVTLAALLLVVLSFFSSLTVEIMDRNVICYFGPGLIRKKIALTDIREVQLAHNPWTVGWGIRWMAGRYWLWNVSGLDAVELTLTSGKKIRIGTDEPETLVRAIQVNKAAAT